MHDVPLPTPPSPITISVTEAAVELPKREEENALGETAAEKAAAENIAANEKAAATELLMERKAAKKAAAEQAAAAEKAAAGNIAATEKAAAKELLMERKSVKKTAAEQAAAAQKAAAENIAATEKAAAKELLMELKAAKTVADEQAAAAEKAAAEIGATEKVAAEKFAAETKAAVEPPRNARTRAPFPAPRATTSEVVVFVLSGGDDSKRRQVIRETWAKGHDNVYFVVGHSCPLPSVTRKSWSCRLQRRATKDETWAWTRHTQKVEAHMVAEQGDFGDMLRVDDTDVYRSLPNKLKSAYAWGVAETGAKWFVKADDDSVVRVGTLAHYLTTTFDSTKPVVVGHIVKDLDVDKSGKWAEKVYTKSKYPNFPLGSHGHCVSRTVAAYIAEHKNALFNYQGEDVSIGIWLNESPLRDQVQWVTSNHTSNQGKCLDPKLYIIGHDIGTRNMRLCFASMDEAAHMTKQVGSPS